MQIKKEDIKKYLPHREPFLFIDEVVSIKDDNQIPNMKIADIQFWYDYIQNHKRVLNHKKIRKELRKEKKHSDENMEENTRTSNNHTGRVQKDLQKTKHTQQPEVTQRDPPHLENTDKGDEQKKHSNIQRKATLLPLRVS